MLDAERLRAACLHDPGIALSVVDFLALQVRGFAAALIDALFVPVETGCCGAWPR